MVVLTVVMKTVAIAVMTMTVAMMMIIIINRKTGVSVLFKLVLSNLATLGTIRFDISQGRGPEWCTTRIFFYWIT